MADLPIKLQSALETLVSGYAKEKLEKDARAISEAYRLRTGEGKRLLTAEGEAAAYAAARMPATYAAAYFALSEAIEASGLHPETMLDCGAGTGAVTFAADSLLELKEATCLEREAAMRTVGEKLTRQACGVQPRWDACDLTGSAALPQAELVCEGYMLGELEAGMRLSVAERLWNTCGQMLVLIEPGTPQGFANLRAVRERLTAMGAYVAAPCPQGSGNCPMTVENWCHFAVRVQRTRLHKALKGGDAPFEDEKFSYLVLTRQKPDDACRMRVLRHAQIAPGRITVPVCGEAGEKLLTVTKKDPLWKRVRKIKWGERL